METAPKTTKELRKFGFVMTIAFGLLAGVLFWKGKFAWVYLASLSSVFLLPALIYPRLLSPVEYYWMAFAEKLGEIMTRVILTLLFFLVVTPLGLCIRLFGKDLLGIKIDKDAESYWIRVPDDSPGTRHYLPY